MAEGSINRRELFAGIALALAGATVLPGLPSVEELARDGRLYERGGMTVFPYYNVSGKLEGHVIVEIMNREQGFVRYRKAECKWPPYYDVLIAGAASEPFYVDPRYLVAENG